ncbi:hypothetical protein BJV78DRAFT_922860 [Lactifluus subvellereus]|nr:hypothetical protein BJV78DRAFT_922860 [Lactifluus subvellereus]
MAHHSLTRRPRKDLSAHLPPLFIPYSRPTQATQSWPFYPWLGLPGPLTPRLNGIFLCSFQFGSPCPSPPLCLGPISLWFAPLQSRRRLLSGPRPRASSSPLHQGSASQPSRNRDSPTPGSSGPPSFRAPFLRLALRRTQGPFLIYHYYDTNRPTAFAQALSTHPDRKDFSMTADQATQHSCTVIE